MMRGLSNLPSSPALLFCTPIICALLTGCQEEPPNREPPLRPVKSIVAGSGSAALRERVFSGSARSAEEAELSFKVSGTVADVPVNVGDALAPGELVAALDQETFAVELEQALADQASANASRRNAEAEYQRVRQLYTNDNASRNELDTALADAESAKASHNASIQAARLARLNLQYTRLLAAASCTIADLQIESNENVTAGQTVATVNCGEGWEVQLSVPESLIASFSNGLAGSVRFPAFPERTFEGIVSEVGVGTGNSRTFPVTLALTTLPDEIRANLAAEVRFQFVGAEADSQRLYLPAAAVVKDESGTFVYIVAPTDQRPGAATLERRPVSTGELSELGMEILSGVAAGERVVTAGQINARDGMLVQQP